MEMNKDWIFINNINIEHVSKVINRMIKNQTPMSTENRSTEGKKSKQYELFDLINSHEIINIMKEHILQNMSTFIKQNIQLNLLSAWTVLGDKGSYHTLHRHNEKKEKYRNQIASVLYLDVPKNSSKEQGNFYCVLRDNDSIKYYTHKPKQGDLIIFPVWLWHGVYPQEKGLRQTLNLDFEINAL